MAAEAKKARLTAATAKEDARIADILNKKAAKQAAAAAAASAVTQ